MEVLKRRKSDRIDISEIFDFLTNILFGSWRFRWLSAAMAWLVCASGWLYVLSMPNIYEASTRLFVDTQSSLRPLLRGLAIEGDVRSDVELMVNSISSRPNLQKIAASAGIDAAARTPGDIEKMTNRLQASVSVDLSRDQILSIAYLNNDPATAKTVVTAILESFIQGLQTANRSDSAIAQDFISTKLSEYEALLSEAEDRLADFKKENIGLMPGEGGDYYDRLQREMAKLRTLNANLRLAKQRTIDLERQVAGEAPTFGMMSGDSSTRDGPSTSQIVALEQKLVELRLRYTDEHPDIISIKALIDDLREEQLAASGRFSGAGPTTVPADLNPVYQAMKIQLNAAEVELTQLTTQRNDQARLVADLKRKVDTIPDIEAELTRLNRDYDVNKAQYDALLQRLEKAKLSEDAEESKTDIKFRVIDPPTVPSAPAAPNRSLLLTAVLLGGLVAGVGLAVALNFFRPVFFTSTQLEKQFGVPVLGTIKRMSTATEATANKFKTFLFSTCLAGLIICFGAIVAFLETGTRLATQLIGLSG